MQQRQLLLGDVLDDYCPRECRLTNHVVVAMIGDDVKQTRCTTCDADHDYKQARLPRLRRKTEPPAALAAQGFGAPKLHEQPVRTAPLDEPVTSEVASVAFVPPSPVPSEPDAEADVDVDAEADREPALGADDGPVHRRLIRAALPRIEGQPPAPRQNPEFTIRQPQNNRQNRFRPRHGRGGGGGPMQSNGNRSFGGGYPGQQRQHGGGNHQIGRAHV